MGGKLVGAAIGGVVLLLLGIIVTVGGAQIATANAPVGGCAISPGEGPGPGGGGAAEQKDAILTADQMAVARTIVGVGKGLSIAERGVAIALGTAMQESTLNPNAVSGRSVGLFQQQGEPYADVNRNDPADASRAFYTQLLARVPNYADPAAGSFADIAQTVQASGAGASRYAQWENWATALARQLFTGTPPLGGDAQITCRIGGGHGPIRITIRGLTIEAPPEAKVTGEWTFPNEKTLKAAAAALSYLGTPYVWGGGDLNGPTRGKDNTNGFDCSGLMEYAYGQVGLFIGGDSRSQRVIGGPDYPWSQALPGDLVFYGTGPITAIHHVAMYLGKIGDTPYMVEAPQSGDVVKVSPVRTGGDFRNEVVRASEHRG